MERQWSVEEFHSICFFGVPKAVHLNALMDGVLARYGRQTLAFYTWHRDAWAACFLRGESTNPNPSTRALETPDRSLQLTWFPGIQLLTSHSTTAPLATSVWQEAYQNRSQSEGLSKTRVISTWASRNKSIPGFKQKVELLSRKNWGETSVVFFCWSNPLFQTNRESGISKERLSFFNPLSWPIATALLQDSYKSCGNMNVMRRNC